MDRFTRTRIPARTLFASTVLAAVITVTAKYLSFVGSTMHGGHVDKAGRPAGHAFSLVRVRASSMRPWPRPLALAQEASWARTTPPLFDFLCIYRARGREGINRGQSSNTAAAVRLYFLLEHNYSLVTMSCIFLKTKLISAKTIL